MCCSLVVGKKASATGCVLFATNDDWPGCPGHVHYTAGRNWAKDEKFITVKGTGIPQPACTYGYTYTAAAYETGTRNVSWADGVNDQRVAVSMQGVYAFQNYQKDGDLLECDDVVILMLERGKSARDAIEKVGTLINQYGYTVSSIPGAEGTAAFAVADPDEAFFLEVGPGGYWCARRVDDDHVEYRPNCFGIGDVDFNDSEKFICSPGLYELAVEKKLIQDGDTLNFAKHFGGDYTTLNPKYGGALNPVNTLRKWTVLHRLGGLAVEPEVPLYDCKPMKPVTLRGLMDIMRDDLHDTPYSLAEKPEAGRYHNPFWMEVGTSIAQGGTVICMLAELDRKLPAQLGSRVWFAFCNARLAPFVPCYTGGRGLPEEYQRGECGEFDMSSAWWCFQETAENCYRNYEAIVSVEVIPVFEKLEDKFISTLDNAQEKAAEKYASEPEQACKDLTEATDRFAKEAMETAAAVGRRIKGKYLCNTVLDWI